VKKKKKAKKSKAAAAGEAHGISTAKARFMARLFQNKTHLDSCS
jgi:hypothetical protein